MPAETTRAPVLLADTRRVLSTPHDLAQRMPGFLAEQQDHTRLGVADRERLFAVANLVAYHAVRTADPEVADSILRAELDCLLRLSQACPAAAVAQLGLDPFMNRIRLAAWTGRVDAALEAVDGCLDGAADGPLLHGIGLFTGPYRDRLASLLRTEKLLILWRSGRLSAMDATSAHAIVTGHTEPSSQLRTELELRLGPAETFRLLPGDTLKRTLHRALVHVDCVNPPADGVLLAVIRRGLEQLDAMSFVSPGTPRAWARTALEWFANHSDDQVTLATRAVAHASEQIARSVAESLDAILGPPRRDIPATAVVTPAQTDHIIDLLARASRADTEVAAHAR